MKRYQEEMVNRLLDKYERSKSFTGSNAVNQSFLLQLAKEFPEYADDSKVAEIKAIEEAAKELEEQDLIRCRQKKNGLLFAVFLNMEKLNACYLFVRRKPKSDLNRELTVLLEKYAKETPTLEQFCSRQLTRVAENKKVEHFSGDLIELQRILLALTEVEKAEQETFERDFSIRVFGDSKIFEKIRSAVISILYEYGDFPEKETVLEDLNIVRNPGHVYFKGAGILSVSGQRLDLHTLKGDVAISSSILKDIDRIYVTGTRVVTIENLTTFNSYTPKDEFVIYLGGYHNAARREFIKLLYRQNPEKGYYHYGDIDAGGFYILLHLRRKTGIPFTPLYMDKKTLADHLAYTRKLTENDTRRLKNLLGGEFDEVIAYMLEHNCKLEQEALDV